MNRQENNNLKFIKSWQKGRLHKWRKLVIFSLFWTILTHPVIVKFIFRDLDIALESGYRIGFEFLLRFLTAGILGVVYFQVNETRYKRLMQKQSLE